MRKTFGGRTQAPCQPPYGGASWSWHGIDTAGMKGMALEQPFDTEKRAEEDAMLRYGFSRILGTGRVESASRAQQR
jgi:hypothetical protein